LPIKVKACIETVQFFWRSGFYGIISIVKLLCFNLKLTINVSNSKILNNRVDQGEIFTVNQFFKMKGAQEMNNSYVVAGAKLKCSFGSASSDLQIPTPRYTQIDGKKEAIIDDYQPGRNILPFGMCGSRFNPDVASATARNHGRLTPQPCQPVVTNQWMQGKSDATIEDVPCLLNNSTVRCEWRGVIEITDDGQSTR
jgi:hypothetical protein